MGIDERTDWDQMIKEVNFLIKRLQQKPDSEKAGHSPNPGSILNAYREGDLTFNEAVEELERWKEC